MRFSDEVRIFVRSGSGGNGCVSFRREKFVPRGGPNGGNGGKGGDVILVADSHANNLYDLQYRKHFRAGRGGHGGGSNRQGKNGADRIVNVPPGTLVFDGEKDEVLCDLDEPGARFIVAEGGRGGRGNASFATATNRVPTIADEGEPGRELWIVLELKMIADVGLLGFPSVGKSTLVAAISRVRPKIAAYPFTTLSPNLGTVDPGGESRFVVADIPGLIEGAHRGVGLGHKFLRHIERTRVLVHMLDMDPENGRDPVEDFETLNEELVRYGKGVSEKPQVLAANKVDLPGAGERLEKTVAAFKGRGLDVFPLSAKLGEGLDDLIEALEKALKKLESDGESEGKE